MRYTLYASAIFSCFIASISCNCKSDMTEKLIQENEGLRIAIIQLSECISYEKNKVFIEDGYKSIKIGQTIWMTQNLNTENYNNGDPLPEIKNTKEWRNLTSGAWCYYNNDPNYGKKYGKLYNWYAVKDERGLCPTGWQVASIEEWENLIKHYGGKYLSVTSLKDDVEWDGKNYSGFSAPPSGFRPTPEGSPEGKDFDGLSGGVWWSSTQGPLVFGWIRNSTAMGVDICPNNTLVVNDGWFVGKSVRCVKRINN